MIHIYSIVLKKLAEISKSLPQSEVKTIAELLMKFPDDETHKEFHLDLVRFYIAYRIVHKTAFVKDTNFEPPEYKISRRLIDLADSLAPEDSYTLLNESISWSAQNFKENLTICEILSGRITLEELHCSSIPAIFWHACQKLSAEEQLRLAKLIFHFPADNNVRDNAKLVRFYLAYCLVSGRGWQFQKLDIAYQQATKIVLLANKLPVESANELLESAIFKWPMNSIEGFFELAKLFYQD